MKPRAIACAVAVGLLIGAGLAVGGTYWPAIAPASSAPEEKRGSGASLQFTANPTHLSASAGEPVTILAQVYNVGPDRAVLEFADSCRVAFTVWTQGGLLVYDSSADRACTPTSTRLELEAGEVLRLPVEWAQRSQSGSDVPAGRTYRIHLVLQTLEPSSRLTAEASLAVEVLPIRSRVVFAAQMDRDVYERDEEARVDVLITNTGEVPVKVWSNDGCTFWFDVRDEAGSVVYQFPEDIVACTMVILDLTIGPGETYSTGRPVWNLRGTDGRPLPPGRYDACPTLIHATIRAEVTQVACWAFEIR